MLQDRRLRANDGPPQPPDRVNDPAADEGPFGSKQSLPFRGWHRVTLQNELVTRGPRVIVHLFPSWSETALNLTIVLF